MKETASGWFLLRRYITMHGPYNVQFTLSLIPFSSVKSFTGPQSLFAIYAGLLRLRVLESSASSLFPLYFSTLFRILLFFSFHPATRSVFAEAIYYFPCVIYVRTTLLLLLLLLLLLAPVPDSLPRLMLPVIKSMFSTILAFL